MKPADALRKLLADKAGYPVQPGATRQLLQYLHLLEKWNARINLVGSTEWPIVGPMFQEAVWAAALYPSGSLRHLDVGSGAGFPAIPLRILRPRMHLDLVESREKRAVFLKTVVQDLELKNVTIHCQRLGSFLGPGCEENGWDCVSWKAVRLKSQDISQLLLRTAAKTQFWIFHAKGLPVEDAVWLETELRLLRREENPSRRGWYLSIYHRESC